MAYFHVPEALFGKCRVAFGTFDGVHSGHRAVIERLPGHAGQAPVVLSCEEKGAPVICSEQEKALLLRELGVGRMISVPAEDVRNMKAEDFAREILHERLNAVSVVAGENLRFGSDEKGIMELLAFGEKYGFSVDTVPVVCVDGEPVSADAVRRAVQDGDYAKMERLLLHPHLMIGRIVHGKGEGHRHGMPTANLAPAANKLLPPYGVYATVTRLDGALYLGVTNIGLRPSADASPVPTVETFLMDYSGDIYDKEVLLELHAYIRGIIKFPDGLEAVRRQIDMDVKTARDFFERLQRTR